MFDAIRYAWELRRLQKEKRAIRGAYRSKRNDAKAQGKSDLELDRLFHEERMKAQAVDAEALQLLSFRLIQIAERKLLPHPGFYSHREAWTQSNVAGHWHLTIEAIAELRSAIRREKKERFENWRMWLASFTGLIGALIGLASLLLKKWQ